MPDDKIQWHPAFAKALKLELREYEDAIDIIEEYQLTSKPLEIDIIVVKKIKDVEMMKNIARIFRGNNIVEYKSPDDYLSIDDFYKVKAYAYLYKTLGHGVDEVKIDDITITLVSSRFPEKLAKHLKDMHGIRMKAQDSGIYYLEGVDVQTQLVVVDELPKRENRYVRLLTKRLNIKEEISSLVDEYERNPKDTELEVLVNVVHLSNLVQYMEVCEMARARKLSQEEEQSIKNSLIKLELHEKWFGEAAKNGEAIGEAKGEAKGRMAGKADALIRVLARKFGELPEGLVVQINDIKSIELLDAIMDRIFEISSIEEVKEYLEN